MVLLNSFCTLFSYFVSFYFLSCNEKDRIIELIRRGNEKQIRSLPQVYNLFYYKFPNGWPIPNLTETETIPRFQETGTSKEFQSPGIRRRTQLNAT